MDAYISNFQEYIHVRKLGQAHISRNLFGNIPWWKEISQNLRCGQGVQEISPKSIATPLRSLLEMSNATVTCVMRAAESADFAL
eukprot:936428-Prymnesium_polylepis.1